MFNLDSKIERLNLKPSEVVAIIVSGNRLNVAVAGPEMEMDAHIISTQEGKNRSIYICFHAVLEDKRFFYTSDKCPTTESKIHDIEMEAVKFVEELGFIMIRQNILDEYSGDAKGEYIMVLAPFAEDLGEIREQDEKKKAEKQASGENTENEEYEYEEVEEEVYEEVPIDGEEDDLSQVESAGEVEEDQEMEYEYLDDIITDDGDDFQGKPSKKVEKSVEESKEKERMSESKIVTDSNEKSDLGEEISDAVEFLMENTSAEAISDKSPEGDKVKTQQQEVKPEESVYFVEESQKHLVKILIAL